MRGEAGSTLLDGCVRQPRRLPKAHKDVVYTVFAFAAPPADQVVATSAYNAAAAKWGKTFLKGKFVLGDKLSIADFKVVPFFWAAICCEPNRWAASRYRRRSRSMSTPSSRRSMRPRS